MLIAWLIGVFLNLFIIFLWRCRYIHYMDFEKNIDYWGRIRVNIIVVILFVISSLVPILNTVLATALWPALLFMGASICDGWDDEWRFPKWMTKTIE